MTEREADARLREHYRVERELAERLRSASRSERRGLYREVYDELFRRLPDQPMHLQAADPAARAHEVALQTTLLEPFLFGDTRFLEIGAGDCALALAMAGRVREVVAVDASAEIAADLRAPDNFRLLLADLPPLPLPDAGFDLAYSCHVLEHLHPEDALDYARDVHRLLVPGGRYVVVTPNRLLGPHDISRHFDDVATGLHLREYSVTEAARLLRRAGFAHIVALAGVGTTPKVRSLWRYRLAEAALGPLPRRIRILLLERLAPSAREPFRPLEQVVVAAER